MRRSKPSRARLLAALLLLGAGAAFLTWREAYPPAGRPVVILGTPAPPLPTLDPASVARGAAAYAEFCAACHGVNLEGAPDWKVPLADGSYPPPPHDSTGHTWHHPDSLLIEIILRGGDRALGSKMPAFGDRLSRAQAVDLLNFIRSSWGVEEREYQWWLTYYNP